MKYEIEIGQTYEHWSSNWREPWTITVLDKKEGKILVQEYASGGHFVFSDNKEWVTEEYFEEFRPESKFY